MKQLFVQCSSIYEDRFSQCAPQYMDCNPNAVVCTQARSGRSYDQLLGFYAMRIP